MSLWPGQPAVTATSMLVTLQPHGTCLETAHKERGRDPTRQASGLFLLPFPCHCNPSPWCVLCPVDTGLLPRASCLCLSAVLGGGVGRPACWERVRCFTESYPPSHPTPSFRGARPRLPCPEPSDLTPVSCPVPVSGQLLGQPRVPLPRGSPDSMVRAAPHRGRHVWETQRAAWLFQRGPWAAKALSHTAGRVSGDVWQQLSMIEVHLLLSADAYTL